MKIIYMDGQCLNHSLPIGNFKWRNEDYYKSGKPCTVEADLEYPKDIQIKMRKYPLLPYNRSISFDEKAWLKQYIDNNTENRKKPPCNFQKDIWKLLNNSLYGKTMENQRNRMSINEQQLNIKSTSKIQKIV